MKRVDFFLKLIARRLSPEQAKELIEKLVKIYRE